MIYRILIFLAVTALLCMSCSDSTPGGNEITGTDSDTSATDTSSNGDTGTNGSNDTGHPGDTATLDDTSRDTLDSANTDSATDSNSWGIPSDTDTSCHQVQCAGKIYQCADCIDNDGDGRIDAADPDCLGPCDNNESGFNIDIPGSYPSDCKMECYFDADQGRGNDECEWDYTCDTYSQLVKAEGDKRCDFDPSATDYCDALRASQNELCGTVCKPLVPNGCDCWGCCKIDGDNYRYIGTPGCTLNNIAACDPCTPVPSCNNPCGECELCIGMTTLPDYCLTAVDTDVTIDTDTADDTDNPGDTSSKDTDDTGGGPVYLRCLDGRQPCGQPGDAMCAAGEYCITGCCTVIEVE